MSTSATVPTVEVRVASPPPTLYGPAFWLAYLANTALMIAVGVMFRYADFVTYLGGTEYELGWIVGIGMLGAISMRVLLGVAIDRYGAGRIWIGSLLLVAVSLLGHVWITQLNAPWVYLARILYTTGLAGAFGASITFISQRAPAHRTGEAIGALGSSGFIGMAIGPVVVDAVFAYSTNGRSTVDRMFVTAASITLVAMGLAAMASHYGVNVRPIRRPISLMFAVLRRYHPGDLLMAALAMGIGIGIPFSFVRTLGQDLGIDRIRTFFLVYAAVAFLVRILCRRLPDLWGPRRTVLLGMSCLSVGLLSYLLVRDEWTMMIPAAIGGVAHAFIFPAAVSGGSLAFPLRYRGLATTLILMMFDIGSLIGQPAVGTIIHAARQAGWPPYPTMFVTVSLFVGLMAIWFAIGSRRRAHAAAKLNRGL